MGKRIKIIGAGLFGCCIGYELNRAGHDVTIIEKSNDIMQKASKCNHNRIHFGYHYPRSIETAKQSLDGYKIFLKHYKDCLLTKFPNYYMIAKDSKVNSKEYIDFCNSVSIDTIEKYPSDNFINKNQIDLSLVVQEAVYDYDILKSLVKENIKDIKIKFNTPFDGNIDDCDYLINTSYAGINKVNKLLGVPEIKIKLQDVVIPIFKMNSEPIGLTIMDGPFASIMPKGKNKNEFLLYNVVHSIIKNNNLDIEKIYAESEKYYPFLSNVERVGYWRTTRALPINDNDERLSEIFTYKSHPKIISILSGKITTCHKIGKDILNLI